MQNNENPKQNHEKRLQNHENPEQNPGHALCKTLCKPLFAQAQERMAAQGAHKPLHKAKVLEKTLCGLVQAPISQTLCTLVFRVLALCNLVHALCGYFFDSIFFYTI